MTADILIVDDEQDIRELISDILNDEGYSTRIAKDSQHGFYITMTANHNNWYFRVLFSDYFKYADAVKLTSLQPYI